MSKIEEIYAKIAVTKKMVQLSNAINALQDIATDLHANHALSPNQTEIVLAIRHFVYADKFVRNSAPACLEITEAGDGLAWRLDKLLQ